MRFTTGLPAAHQSGCHGGASVSGSAQRLGLPPDAPGKMPPHGRVGGFEPTPVERLA